MKIVVLGNEEQREELLTQGQDPALELVWASHPGEVTGAANACIDLLFDNHNERLAILDRLRFPITIINSVVDTLDKSSPGFVRINGWNSFLKRPVIEATTHNAPKEEVAKIFSALNKKMEWVPDIAGLVSARIIASIINEAYFALQEQVSTKEEIDTAMKLGTNYPYGPFEWSKRIGIKNIHNLLSRLSQEQKRYEPAALLVKEALA